MDVRIGWALMVAVVAGCGDGGPAPVQPRVEARTERAASSAASFAVANDVPTRVKVGELEVARFWDRGIWMRAYHPTFEGPTAFMTSVPEGRSGAYGLTLSRAADPLVPLTLAFATDSVRQWEVGLDLEADATGQGRGPDFVLAYDDSEPSGDRFRMAPGGYTQHSPTAGPPILQHRFHIVGGTPEVDRAENVLYVQSGAPGKPGAADWLIKGQGRHPRSGQWGREVFGVTVEGKIIATGIEINGRELERIPAPATVRPRPEDEAAIEIADILLRFSRRGAADAPVTYGDLERMARELLRSVDGGDPGRTRGRERRP